MVIQCCDLQPPAPALICPLGILPIQHLVDGLEMASTRYEKVPYVQHKDLSYDSGAIQPDYGGRSAHLRATC